MTTVVFDGHTLATDSRMSGSYIQQTGTSKIIVSPDRTQMAAISGGPLGFVYHYVDWIFGGMDENYEPNPPADYSFNIVLIRKNGDHIYFDDDRYYMPIAPPLALGSGAHFALGALEAGATCEQAIVIASRFDVYTDDRVQSMTIDDLSEPKPKTKKRGRY